MSETGLQIVYKKIEELTPYENNPRKNDSAVDSVMESIKAVGFKNPIIVDRNGVIIAGHTRLKAAKRLELQEVPVIYADDLTDEQARLLRLADNKTSEIADWDDEKLQEEIERLLADGFDMTKYGFDVSDIDMSDADIQEDEAPEPPAEAKSKLGQIYKLGEHRLMCGDSTNPEHLKRLMGGGAARHGIYRSALRRQHWRQERDAQHRAEKRKMYREHRERHAGSE